MRDVREAGDGLDEPAGPDGEDLDSGPSSYGEVVVSRGEEGIAGSGWEGDVSYGRL